MTPEQLAALCRLAAKLEKPLVILSGETAVRIRVGDDVYTNAYDALTYLAIAARIRQAVGVRVGPTENEDRR